MQYKLNVGDRMPSFRCKDEEGQEISDEDVTGSPAVIYFYPKDDTPGCTKEACTFRDSYSELEDTDTLLLGVSPDDVDSHRAFYQKYDLNFPLLSDPDKKMCDAFDVIREGKIERTTFVIDPDGIITWIERPVSVEGHTERVLKAIKAST